ncbi:hypothetical protein BDA99DRAFT_601710 [Phascolomyces articulosus]|uniref:C2H2-type domain-containing protein n=1 Tax=Phascolomyces articulosus TaxID=60185 RepID=A0AAD5KL09_9FUNG|nr:hypothetical protein BDA99DRAFT_601710 [Phascolomyces articulosus]
MFFTPISSNTGDFTTTPSYIKDVEGTVSKEIPQCLVFKQQQKQVENAYQACTNNGSTQPADMTDSIIATHQSAMNHFIQTSPTKRAATSLDSSYNAQDFNINSSTVSSAVTFGLFFHCHICQEMKFVDPMDDLQALCQTVYETGFSVCNTCHYLYHDDVQQLCINAIDNYGCIPSHLQTNSNTRTVPTPVTVSPHYDSSAMGHQFQHQERQKHCEAKIQVVTPSMQQEENHQNFTTNPCCGTNSVAFNPPLEKIEHEPKKENAHCYKNSGTGGSRSHERQGKMGGRIQTTTEAYKFRCFIPGCPSKKTYTRWEDLVKRHIRDEHDKVNPKDPFVCNNCGKRYSRNYVLLRHKRECRSSN